MDIVINENASYKSWRDYRNTTLKLVTDLKSNYNAQGNTKDKTKLGELRIEAMELEFTNEKLTEEFVSEIVTTVDGKEFFDWIDEGATFAQVEEVRNQALNFIKQSKKAQANTATSERKKKALR